MDKMLPNVGQSYAYEQKDYAQYMQYSSMDKCVLITCDTNEYKRLILTEPYKEYKHFACQPRAVQIKFSTFVQSSYTHNHQPQSINIGNK